jgi:uncharacterized protein YacL
MSGRLFRFLEGTRVAWFRIGGLWFIVWSALGFIFGLLMLVMAFVGPASERTSSLLEALALLVVCFLVMLLGMRLVSVTAKELRDAPAQLVKRRDRFEAWINRESKDV